MNDQAWQDGYDLGLDDGYELGVKDGHREMIEFLLAHEAEAAKAAL